MRYENGIESAMCFEFERERLDRANNALQVKKSLGDTAATFRISDRDLPRSVRADAFSDA